MAGCMVLLLGMMNLTEMGGDSRSWSNHSFHSLREFYTICVLHSALYIYIHALYLYTDTCIIIMIHCIQ